MSTTPKMEFAFRIADGIFKGEVAAQRMMGADWIDAYNRAWAIYDEAYLFVIDTQDKAAVYPQHRGFITGRKP